MTDPPPEDPSGQPQPPGGSLQPLRPPGGSLQPLRPAGESPQLHQPVLPLPVTAGVFPDQPCPAMNSGQPPLSDLPTSGPSAVHLHGVKAATAVFEALESQAAAKIAPSHRSSVVAPHRKIKKMKLAAKSHLYQALAADDSILQKSKEAAFDAHDKSSHHGRPAVVQPLHAVEAEDVSLSERDDGNFSDEEEDEEEFDLESYYIDETKRAELRSLMEKYDVYDEEQLRLALRRERKSGENMLCLAGKLHPSTESAPVSPTKNPSKFIPPQSIESLTNLGDPNPMISAHNAHCLIEIPATSLAQNPNPMQPTPLTMQTHTTMQPHTPCSLQTPCSPNTMQSPNAMQPLPTPMQPPHTPMHNSTPNSPSTLTPRPILAAQTITPTPTSGHMELDTDTPPGPNNPLAMGNLTDFPPLPKGSMVTENGGSGDTVMVPVEEGDSRPKGAPRHINSSSSTAPRPPTSLAERVKNSAPPSAPVAFNPTKYTPNGAKGEREGTPVISFSKTDTECLAGRVGLAVVGKFSHSIPSSHNINKALNNIPIKGTLAWNFLNAKHVLIMLSNVEDYAKLLHGVNGMPVWYVESVPMRVFKWTPEFDPSFETPIVAVWCNLPALPIHLYDQRALYMICSSLGNPIQVDYATAARSRISYARVCVEIDITKPPVEEFVIDMAGVEVRQKVVWDKIPRYCSDCKHVGHLPEACYAFGRNARPVKKAAPQARAPAPRAKGVSRDTSSAHGSSTPPAPPKAPHDSLGSGQRARAPRDRPAHSQPRSPSRAHGHPGSPRPQHGSSGAPPPARSPPTGSASGLRPLRMGERHLRPSSRSPSRAPVAPDVHVAPGARGAPRSPPRSPTAPVVSRAHGAPHLPSRGLYAPVGTGDPLKRHSSPRSSNGRTQHDSALGEWIEVAQSKQKTSTHESVADVPIKNSFRVLDDGTEVLMADYESEDDRDIEMAEDNRDMAVDSVQGSSIPNRGRVLPASLGGNLRSGVPAPVSS